MSFDDLMLAGSSGMLSALGLTVTYTPSGGSAVELQALVNDEASFGDIDALMAMVEIRKVDIAFTPAAEDKVVINGVGFKVHDGKGARIDGSDAVWWKLPVIGEERATMRGRRR